LKKIILMLLIIANVEAQEICSILNGSKILAQDDENTYLGKITNSFDSNSIFNDYGAYGSEFNAKSIWNEFSTFGSKFSMYSPFNNFTSTPPMIIKNGKIIAYLSSNKNIASSISANLIKALCKDELR